MVPAMCSNAFVRSSTVNLTVARHVEVIADVVEATVVDVILPTLVKTQAHALRRGRAMNNEQGNRAHGYLQEPRPKAPAKAVATVMITLSTMPHTDFDFLSSLMMIDN